MESIFLFIPLKVYLFITLFVNVCIKIIKKLSTKGGTHAYKIVKKIIDFCEKGPFR